jgi:hypothetical protein
VLAACRSAWRSLQRPAASALAVAVGVAATIPAAALPRHLLRGASAHGLRRRCVAEEGVMGSWRWGDWKVAGSYWSPFLGGDFFPHLHAHAMCDETEAITGTKRETDNTVLFFLNLSNFL